MKLTIEDIRTLIKCLDESSVDELKYGDGDGKLILKKCVAGATGQSCVQIPAPETTGKQGAGIAAPDAGDGTKMAGGGQEAEVSAEKSQPEAAQNGACPVTAPLAGVFYRASKPGEKPYVESGQKVKKGDTVGLIEAMKMMSEIPAPCSGVVETIEVKDSDFAAYGTTLMYIREN
jgi:acetyl-CoA carboxylase biotin carboxyl carrier protein